jgi:hypothetical protein
VIQGMYLTETGVVKDVPDRSHVSDMKSEHDRDMRYTSAVKGVPDKAMSHASAVQGEPHQTKGANAVKGKYPLRSQAYQKMKGARMSFRLKVPVKWSQVSKPGLGTSSRIAE